MAKKHKIVLVRLVSTAETEGPDGKKSTGVFFVKKRNPKTQTEKLSFRKIT